jgi:transposase
VAWLQRRTTGKVLVAIEGTGSYGANLTRTLQTEGIAVCDVRPPKRASRAGKGKSDEIDAIAAARTALASATGTLAAPRADGIRSALRVLLVARRAIDSHRTADRNMLTALLRSFDLGVDARKPLTDAQVRSVAGRPRYPASRPGILPLALAPALDRCPGPRGAASRFGQGLHSVGPILLDADRGTPTAELGLRNMGISY